MKRLLLTVFSVLAFAFVSFGATVGLGGVAVSPSTALTGDNFVWNTFTTTYTAVTNVVNGIVYNKYPFKTWGTAVSKVVVAGNAVEIGPIMTWNNGADYFYGVTVTAANAAKLRCRLHRKYRLRLLLRLQHQAIR
jgi:hypothetical protein